MNTGDVGAAAFLPGGGVDMVDPVFVVDFSSLAHRVVFIQTSSLKLN